MRIGSFHPFKQLPSIGLFHVLILLIISSCSQEESAISGQDLEFRYEVVALDLERGATTVAMTLTNNSRSDLGTSGWDIYYNQLSGNPGSSSIGQGLELIRVQGDFWKISPTQDFKALKSGASLEVRWDIQGLMTSANFLPFTPFVKWAGKEDAEVLFANILPISNDLIPESMRYTSADRWEENAEFEFDEKVNAVGITPGPGQVSRRTSDFLELSTLSLYADDTFAKEASWFQEFMQGETGMNVAAAAADQANIKLTLDNNLSGEEVYELEINAEGVEIFAAQRAGAFYGLQTLIGLFPIEQFAENRASLVLPHTMIVDEPAFAYRGFHLDISRNFLPADAVKKTLKLLAFYKINKFHLHMTDDEGWRLEIPEIPELVSVGARRGFTEAEEGYIHPAFGSGPYPDAASNYGSGYYTQEDLVEILQLAAEHHIDVIPEIDLPGHARAAIIALEHHFKATGNDQYRLLDPDDTSEYLSIQNFPDNVVNVCQQSTYDFIGLVVDNLINIYERAGLELPIVHIGGDEVPKGVWTASPQCADLISQTSELNSAAQLQEYFFYRANELLKSKGIRMAGWEEIVEQEYEGTYEDKSMIPFVWHQADEGYRLANEGYDVILCNATNLYFDLSYDRDPRETGLHWAGYVGTKEAFSFMPFNFQLPFNENSGTHETRTILTSSGQEHIYGLQAQLWSETVFNGDMLEYYLLPKLMGFAERAWNGEPDWKVDQGKLDGFSEDWTAFAQRVGTRDLPRLDHLYGGWNYRVSVPGVKVVDGKAEVNTDFPGFEIRYTTDGSQPNAQSSLYEGPVEASENLTFRAFSQTGRGSKTSRIE